MAEVAWTDQAIADVAEIVAWVSSDKPLAAVRLARRLQEAGNRLDPFPGRGRALSRDRRELTVVPPYLIRYRVEDARVLILEVRHGARKPDAD